MRRKNTFNSSSLTDSYRWFLEHLYDEHLKGHYLTAPQIQILEDHNYIKPLARPKKEKPIRLVGEGSRDFTISHPNEIPATQKTDITIVEDEQPFNTSVDNLEEQDSVDILTEEEHQVKAEKMVYEGRENIKQSDWLPEDLINHKQDFVDWINSITNGFKTKREYKKFNLYVQQANDWYAENKSEADFDSEEERIDYVKNEYTRCAQNTLYFANKYCYLQEPLLPNGRRKYYATDDYEHHKVLFYLFDCEYSLLIGKPRQGGFTSAFGICGVKRTLFRRNHYLKFITEDEMTGVEIFRDKFKYCFGELPYMLKPNVANDAAKIFAVGHKNEKGDVSGINSRMEIVAPKRTAINGGSPSLVMVDEVDTIGILTEMINEGRPALFWKNPQKGNKLEMRRELIMWGCVCAGTKVWTNNGDFINIEDLTPEQGILGYNGEGVSKEEITYWQPPFKKPCYRITTNTGRYLDCSEDHPILWSTAKYGITPRSLGRKFFKQTKFVEAKDIKIGEQVAIIESVPIFGNKQMWNPRLIGWLIGDGTYGVGVGRMARLFNCDEEINTYIESNFDTITEKTHITKDGRLYKETRFRGITPELKKLGIHGQSKLKKRLPNNIHSYTKHDICELLGGFFDTDGCVHYTGGMNYIDLTSSCYELLDEVRFLLQKIGVRSNIKRIKANPLTNPMDKNDWYVLYVCDIKSIREFYKHITFFVKYKQDRFNIVINNIKDKKDFTTKTIKGLRFEKVTSVEYIGIRPVYNLTAGTTNTYIANGIVTHNTGVIKKDGKGRGVFEAEWKRMSGLWRDGKYDAGIIPVFFDWTVRCTEAEYLQQKEYYFGVRASQEGISVETSKLQFGLHYPSTPEDMFYSNEKTVVPRDYVNNALDRIRNLDPLLKAEYGFFEPVLDNAGKIIDARFVLCDEIDSRVTTVMFQRPKKGWINRYYQGTDPIGADTGHSKMASAIFDKQYCTVSALVNYRAQGDASSSFMQCLLLGVYFDTEHHFGVPELLEKNIGLAYVQFLETQGFYNRLVFNSELQDYFQSGEKNAPGIDNKGNRNKLIIAKLQELINQYGHKIFIDVFFIQLKTFVCNITRSGNETWETIDKQYYFDDVLFAITFAYICSETYQFRLPKEIGNEMYEQKVTYEYAHDAHWNLVLRQKTLVEKVA